MKTLILYTFHELNERVKYFLKHAIFEDTTTDFLIIINSMNLEIDVPSYVKIMKRENIGFDFGAWSEGLLQDNLYKSYDRFLFVNSSAIGPFVPSDSSEKWTDLFFNGVQGTTKLFGCTINTCENPKQFSHVQSYVFAVEKETLEHLINSSIFSLTNHARTYHEAVWNKEVLMSRLVLQQGWNIGCRMKYYNDVDFTFQTKQPEDYTLKFLDDIMYEHFHDKMWNKQEVVFAKGNRLTNNGISL
jgi:hypothetical protein